MDIVVSGIRPTGHLHLGNYFGAIKNFVSMQDKFKCFFFIADYHSLTTHPKTSDLLYNIKSVLAEYIACGLDPEKCTMYVQSDVSEVSEMYLLLNMISHISELSKCVTFKEQREKQKDNINAGLLTYPVLMAADILLHRANKVPVGKDQEQHLEIARDIAQRFNNLYTTNFFPLPSAFTFNKDLIRVPGLNQSGKMCKSNGNKNAIFLIDEPNTIRKKIMSAMTDNGPTDKNKFNIKSEPVENLFKLMELVSTKETLDYFESKYIDSAIKYSEFKNQLSDDIIKFTTPIRDKIQTVDNKYLSTIRRMGAEKAKDSARLTLKISRELMGLSDSRLMFS